MTPELAPFIPFLASPDQKAQDEAFGAMTDILKNRATEIVKQKPQLGDLYAAVKDGDAQKIAELADKHGVSANELSTLINAAGQDPTTLQQNAQQLVRDGVVSDVSDGMLKLSAALAGQNPDVRRQDFNIDHGQTLYKQYAKSYQASQRLEHPIKIMDRVTQDLILEGTETGNLTGVLGMVNSAAASLSHLVPGASFNSAQEVVSHVTGIDATQYGDLTTAEKILAFEVARQYLEGQGSVSDSERLSAAQTIANGGTTHAVRMNALASLKANNAVDEILYREFSNYAADNPGFDDVIGKETDLVTTSSEIRGALTTAFSNRYRLKFADQFDDPEMLRIKNEVRGHLDRGEDVPEELAIQIRKLSSPTLSAQAANMSKNYLRSRGFEYYYDAQTNELVQLPK